MCKWSKDKGTHNELPPGWEIVVKVPVAGITFSLVGRIFHISKDTVSYSLFISVRVAYTDIKVKWTFLPIEVPNIDNNNFNDE